MKPNSLNKFYVATDYFRKEDARDVATELLAFGLVANARWVFDQPLFKEGGLGGELEDEDAANARLVAGQDTEDIRNAKIFIQLTNGEPKRGGNHVELGYAIALAEDDLMRTVIAVGPREHAFHYHPKVLHLDTFEELKDWAKSYMEGAKL